MGEQTRRLLTETAISMKLGQPHDWFENYRGSLEQIKFPQPCLPAEEFGDELWDERAIDLWLDGRIPAALVPKQTKISAEAKTWEQTLSDRGEGISL